MFKLISYLLIALVVMSTATGCLSEKSQSKRVEIGKVPSEIRWNGLTYKSIGKKVIVIGNKIGETVAQKGEDSKKVYEIQGVDPSKKVALKMLNKSFIVFSSSNL